MSGDKTEKPTPQRLRKARKEGQVPRTPELGAWAGIGVASVVLPRCVRSLVDGCHQLLVEGGVAIGHPSVHQVAILGMSAGKILLGAFLPLGLALLGVGVAASAAQGGVHLAPKAMKPSLKKLNPWHGVKRMFGVQGVWETSKALIKCAALALALWKATDTARTLLAASGALPLTAIVDTACGAAVAMLRIGALTGLALAAADYAVVRKRMMKQLRMSKHDIKQEMRQSDGDPLVKHAIRSRQMAMSRNRMMAQVADADVVLVNPVHVAVAVRYVAGRGAPRVVAKGSGVVAAKLREKATEARVPIVEDIPLARALHASCDLGQEIPTQLFTTVARVLAFVMHLRAQGAAAGWHRPYFPPPPVEGLPRAGRRRRPDPVPTRAPATAPAPASAGA